jgi:hypothetical protein
MLWVSKRYMVRYATRIFIAKIIFVSPIRFGPLNTMVPLTFITMAFGFDQHRNRLNGGKEDLSLPGHRLVKRRHTHVGAPDNRIEGSI